MPKIAGVKFPYVLKAAEYEVGDLNIALHQNVVTEGPQGLELGQVIYVKEVKELPSPEMPKVLRIATSGDLARNIELTEMAKSLFSDFSDRIKKYDLKMRPIGVSYSLDETRIVYYFTADGRVDFRELAKELSRSQKKQAILKQIGPRDEAKIIGGYGRCGRPICCATFMSSSDSITIEDAEQVYGMAKSANKISGVCGRLMCCIRFEEPETSTKKPFGRPQGGGKTQKREK